MATKTKISLEDKIYRMFGDLMKTVETKGLNDTDEILMKVLLIKTELQILGARNIILNSRKDLH